MIILENTDIALRIKRIIETQGIKQKFIAQKLNLSAKAFNDILNGRKVFRVEFVLPICEALKITPNDFFGFNSEYHDERR